MGLTRTQPETAAQAALRELCAVLHSSELMPTLVKRMRARAIYVVLMDLISEYAHAQRACPV